MPATLDDLVTNGFSEDDAAALLADADDIEMVELPAPVEFLTEIVGLTEDEAVDMLCNIEAPPLEHAFYSPAHRRWFFAREGHTENIEVEETTAGNTEDVTTENVEDVIEGEEVDDDDDDYEEEFEPSFLHSVLGELGVALHEHTDDPAELMEVLDEVGQEAGEDIETEDAYYSAATEQWYFSEADDGPVENEAAEDPDGAGEHYHGILNELGVVLEDPHATPAQLVEILDEVGQELTEDVLTQNVFYSAKSRRWYFANLGKKGGPVNKKGKAGGKGGTGAAGGVGAGGAGKDAKEGAIAKEATTAPPPGKYYHPDPEPPKGGMAKAARVGVPADEVPPPPKVPRLPNLTKAERKAESEFAKAFEKDPDAVAKRYLDEIAKADTPPKFETDAAKMLSPNWVDTDPAKQAQKRSHFNTALHQTANAVTKKAFMQHLDTLKPGDELLVTNGGCGAGKGHALKNVPEAKALKDKVKAVWDSAGDQNATENSWIQAEAEKRGLKVNYVYVHADPKNQWAHPDRGVVSRASKPDDGRMVDAAVFADSYAHGVRNMQAFVEANKNNKNASFTYLDNTSDPKLIPGIPKDAFVDRDEIYKYASSSIKERQEIPAHIKRGATAGERIWKGG